MGNYPGSKGGSGVWQRIISEMPAHDVYIEPFLGTGAIMKAKRPAPRESIGIDLDTTAPGFGQCATVPGFRRVCDDAVAWLARRKWTGSELVYCDPPYLMATRSTQQRYYRHELLTDGEHGRLLDVVQAIPVPVMLSGYRSALYDARLAGWRRVDIPTVNRAGTRVIECLWLSFPPPARYHDASHAGKDHRDRWRIKKRIRRWRARLELMDPCERDAIMQAIEDLTPAGGGDKIPAP